MKTDDELLEQAIELLDESISTQIRSFVCAAARGDKGAIQSEIAFQVTSAVAANLARTLRGFSFTEKQIDGVLVILREQALES